MNTRVAPPPQQPWWVQVGKAVWSDGAKRTLFLDAGDRQGLWTLRLNEGRFNHEPYTWDTNTRTFVGKPEGLGDAAPAVSSIIRQRSPWPITSEQRSNLRTIFEQVDEHGWCSGKRIRHALGLQGQEDTFYRGITPLGPRYIRQRWSAAEPSDTFGLTLPGLLEVDEPLVERATTACLELLRKKFLRDPDFRDFTFAEFEPKGDLKIGELLHVLSVANLANGLRGSENDWTWGVPNDIEALATIRSYGDFKQTLTEGRFPNRAWPTAPALLPDEWPKETLDQLTPPPLNVRTKPTSRKFITAFDEYLYLAKIGEGGNGIVYKVRNNSGEEFALKLIPKAKTRTTTLKRFKNEIGFCLRNRHENIVTVVDWGVATDSPDEAKNGPFCVMPFFPKTLRELMDEKLSPERAIAVFAKILDGVEAAHLRSVVHRDLKPENILVKGDQVVVADFGIAHFSQEDLLTPVQTRPQDRLANFHYAAPEQRLREGKVDSRADIYALGLLLNELFTGQVPEGNEPPKIASSAPTFAFLDVLVEKMRQHDPLKRPATIADVKLALAVSKTIALHQQVIDQKRDIVVPASKVETESYTIKSFDYETDHLVVHLSGEPSGDWRRFFENPREVTGWMGDGPNSVFAGSSVHSRATPVQAQRVLDSIKRLVQEANNQFAAAQVKEFEASERRLIAEETERQKKEIIRAQVLASLVMT